jgi:outer membrane immunogenic protein
MKSMVLSGVAAVACLAAGSALAADMPVKAGPVAAVSPVTQWGGFYFGGSLGGAWERVDNEQFIFLASSLGPFPNASSWIAGLHTSTLWQFGWLVAGFDTNYRFTDLDTSQSVGECTPFICSQRTKNIFTTGGRAGVAWNNFQFYGTGGYARTQIDLNVVSATTGAFTEGGGRWHDGWFGGGGVEWAFTPSIHFGVLYTHVHANTKTINPTPFPSDSRTANANIDMVEARVSFKLWGQDGPFVAR